MPSEYYALVRILFCGVSLYYLSWPTGVSDTGKWLLVGLVILHNCRAGRAWRHPYLGDREHRDSGVLLDRRAADEAPVAVVIRKLGGSIGRLLQQLLERVLVRGEEELVFRATRGLL